MEETFGLGQLVYSKAGRDKGRAFLVVSLVGNSFAYLVDGEMRKVEKPKKKNLKHLDSTGIIAYPIARKLERGESLTNEEVRLAIASLVGKDADTARQGG